MEIVILALLGILLVGAVVAPLFRGRGDYTDEEEYATGPVPAAHGSAAVPAVADTGAAAATSDDALEAEVARYRDALKAGTLCRRCGEANPANARFCRECGKALPASDAQEFAR